MNIVFSPLHKKLNNQILTHPDNTLNQPRTWLYVVKVSRFEIGAVTPPSLKPRRKYTGKGALVLVTYNTRHCTF